MKSINNHISWVIIFLLGYNCNTVSLKAFEKIGVTSFQFLKVMPDARATALGEAYSSVASGAEGLYWNPAALITTEKFSLNFSRVNYIFDTAHNGVAGAYRWRQFAFGVVLLNADYGTIAVTDVAHLGYRDDGTYNPGLTGESIHPGALVVGCGLAQRLTDKFTYGLTMKYATENMALGDSTVIGIPLWDLGILYETGFRSIRLAATMRNFGPPVKYFDYAYPLPQTMNIGISANLWGPAAAILGVSSYHRLLVAFDLIQPRDYDQQYGIGVEYTFRNVVALRGGYKLNYDCEGLTFGAGLCLKGVSVDYSFNDYGEYLDSVHRFTIGFTR